MAKPLKELLKTYDFPPVQDSNRAAEEMARRLRKLDERHRLCEKTLGRCECGTWLPCPDRRILEGGEP